MKYSLAFIPFNILLDMPDLKNLAYLSIILVVMVVP
jgi:hypothetical protein